MYNTDSDDRECIRIAGDIKKDRDLPSQITGGKRFPSFREKSFGKDRGFSWCRYYDSKMISLVYHIRYKRDNKVYSINRLFPLELIESVRSPRKYTADILREVHKELYYLIHSA